MLPEWVSPAPEACKRLTRILQQADHDLVCVWNRAAQEYQVWGKDTLHGMVLITRVTRPDGSLCHPDVVPRFMLQKLREMRSPAIVGEIDQRNEKKIRDQWARELDRAGAETDYLWRAIAEEGPIRHGGFGAVARSAIRAVNPHDPRLERAGGRRLVSVGR